MTTAELSAETWQTVCDVSELLPNIGVRALIDGKQIALFCVKGNYYAISAIDPFTSAAVLSRGIVGDIKGQVVVASPIYKQHFSLATGQCLEDDAVKVKTYLIRNHCGSIEIAT